jgi:uncharacterized protein
MKGLIDQRCFLGAIFLSVSFAASSSTMDCSNFDSYVQQTICNSPELRELDEKYVMALNAAMLHAADVRVLVREAEEWKENREACRSVTCIEEMYLTQIELLMRSATIPSDDSGETTSPDSLASERKNEVPQHAEPQGQPQQLSHSPIPSQGVKDAQPQQVSVGPAASAGLAEKTNRPSALKQQMMKLTAVLTVVALLALLVLGATNNVVIFYDHKDAWWSLSPVAIMGSCFLLATGLAPPDAKEIGTTLLEKFVLTIGGVGALLGVGVTFLNAIRYNRSIALGILVGVCKAIVSLLMALTFWASFRTVMNSKATAREASVAALTIAMVGVLWHLLVNGQRVYEKKGWHLQQA